MNETNMIIKKVDFSRQMSNIVLRPIIRKHTLRIGRQKGGEGKHENILFKIKKNPLIFFLK